MLSLTETNVWLCFIWGDGVHDFLQRETKEPLSADTLFKQIERDLWYQSHHNVFPWVRPGARHVRATYTWHVRDCA